MVEDGLSALLTRRGSVVIEAVVILTGKSSNKADRRSRA
jgi:hypothetical protein